MIHVVEGSLLESDCTVIAHQMNVFRVMEDGVAALIRHTYPKAYEADKYYRLPPRERLGRFSFALIEKEPRFIFNLYGQFRHKESNSLDNYGALRDAMEKMFQAIAIADEKGFKVKLGMPYGIGTKNSKDGWQKVLGIIEELSVRFNQPVYLYTRS